MKKTCITFLSALALSTSVQASDVVKVGIVLGFTGPIESLTPAMASASEMALKHASDTKAFLGGKKIEVVKGDSTCVDAAAATTTVERLVTSDKVAAIVGPDCSGVTIASVNNVAAPKGVVLVSPSATSPALTTIKDNGYFFRVAPSDARQGQVLAKVIKDRGINKVAVSYTNNDYGKGLQESFGAAYKKLGGTVIMASAHEDGKADYSAEVAALAASGSDTLVVFGYVDQGGKGVIEASIDTDAFKNFFGSDGMFGNSLIEALGSDIEGFVTTSPGSESPARKSFFEDGKANGLDANGPFTAESYDAAALIALAIQSAGSTDRASIKAKMMAVANAPGEKIHYGELAKAMDILAKGGDIDYVGVTSVEFTEVGETQGQYVEQEIRDGAYSIIKTH